MKKWGNIQPDESGRTSVEGVWADGRDIVTGSALAIEAMGAGKQAVRDIHAWRSGQCECWKPQPIEETA